MADSLKKIKVVLIDLSGTLHIDNFAIPGAVEALDWLLKSGLNIKFVTNTTKESTRVLHTRVTNLGFNIKRADMFSSLKAARKLIDNRKLNPLCLVDSDAEEEFEDLVSNSKTYDSVLVGLAPDKFDYAHMNQAFRLLLDGAPLIGIHKGRYYKRPDGLALGPGPFIAALEYASGVPVEVVGKPTKAFFLSSIAEFGVQPCETVMIGDDVRDDIIGALDAGMSGILVRTGKFRDGDDKALPIGSPSTVVNSFPDAVELILAAKEG